MTLEEMLRAERGEALVSETPGRQIKGSGKQSFQKKYEGLPDTLETFNSTDFVHLYRMLSGSPVTNYARDAACVKKCMTAFDLKKPLMFNLITYIAANRKKYENFALKTLTTRYTLNILKDMGRKRYAEIDRPGTQDYPEEEAHAIID